MRRKKSAPLLARLQAGDPAALEEAIDLYTPYVATVIRCQLGQLYQPADGEELCADVFVKLWQNCGQVKQESSLKSWLGTVARNLARSSLRKMGELTVPLEDMVLIGGDNTLELTARRERHRMIQAALDALGKVDREVFLRRYYYNQKVGEIAGEMGLTQEAVKSKLRRGRVKLKKTLCEGGYSCEDSDF